MKKNIVLFSLVVMSRTIIGAGYAYSNDSIGDVFVLPNKKKISSFIENQLDSIDTRKTFSLPIGSLILGYRIPCCIKTRSLPNVNIKYDTSDSLSLKTLSRSESSVELIDQHLEGLFEFESDSKEIKSVVKNTLHVVKASLFTKSVFTRSVSIEPSNVQISENSAEINPSQANGKFVCIPIKGPLPEQPKKIMRECLPTPNSEKSRGFTPADTLKNFVVLQEEEGYLSPFFPLDDEI